MEKSREEVQIQKSFSQIVEESNTIFNEILESLQNIRNSEVANQEVDSDDIELLKSLENLVILNNSYLTQSLDALEQMNRLKNENSQYRDSIKALETRCQELEEYKGKFKKAENQIDKLRIAKSFRVSRALVEAIKKPGKNTIKLPYQLFKIITS